MARSGRSSVEEQEAASHVRIFSEGPLNGQRGLFASRPAQAGDVLLIEKPLMVRVPSNDASNLPYLCPYPESSYGKASQHLWNRSFGYDACAHCLRSLETASAMTSRLLNEPEVELPLQSQCLDNATDPKERCKCSDCGEMYCSQTCAERADAHYHKCLCVHSKESAAVSRIEEKWKQIQSAIGESSSITIILRLLATVQQKLNSGDDLNAASAHLDFLRAESEFESEQEHKTHRLKLLSTHEAALQDIWKTMSNEIFTDERLGVWRTWNQFVWLLSGICTNAVSPRDG